jgi:hypothetical protein
MEVCSRHCVELKHRLTVQFLSSMEQLRSWTFVPLEKFIPSLMSPKTSIMWDVPSSSCSQTYSVGGHLHVIACSVSAEPRVQHPRPTERDNDADTKNRTFLTDASLLWSKMQKPLGKVAIGRDEHLDKCFRMKAKHLATIDCLQEH